MSTKVNEVKKMIQKMFDNMNTKISDIIVHSTNTKDATQIIMEYVSSTVSSDSLGYMSYLYAGLSEMTLKEPIFVDVVNANKFYKLGLRQKIVDVYEFDINKFDTFEEGIDLKEINRIYASASAAVGSATVGGILMGVISGVVELPMTVIIAGAILVGIAGGGITYTKIVPNQNKKKFEAAVFNFMKDLENSMINWVDDVVHYYNEQVEELKKTL